MKPRRIKAGVNWSIEIGTINAVANFMDASSFKNMSQAAEQLIKLGLAFLADQKKMED